MSLIRHACDLVESIGSGTVDDILPACNCKDRTRVAKAMHKARDRGLLRRVGSKTHPGRGNHLAVYESTGAARSAPAVARFKAASVWDYAQLVSA